MRIRAAVLDRPGERFKIDELELDPPRRSEVRVRVHAAGICHSDLHVVKGHSAEPLPAVLGHEGSGTIEAVGDGVKSLRPGQPVVLSWVRGCGRCALCAKGKPNLCTEGIAVGTLPEGGTRLRRGEREIFHYAGVSCFATHAVLPESMVVPVPEGTDLEVAALVGCAVSTGVGAVLNTARVPPGASAVVIGCGGVGLSILQGLRLAKAAKVLALDIGEVKLKAARAAGAHAAVDVSSGDPVASVLELTGGGADFVFEAVGALKTALQAVEMTAPGGAAVIVGVPADGARLEIPLHGLWSGERRILTSMYGSCQPHRDFPRLLELDASGSLDLRSLITRRYPLERINEAYEDLESGAPGRGILTLA